MNKIKYIGQNPEVDFYKNLPLVNFGNFTGFYETYLLNCKYG